MFSPPNFFGQGFRRRLRRQPSCYRLMVEALEDRSLMSASIPETEILKPYPSLDGLTKVSHEIYLDLVPPSLRAKAEGVLERMDEQVLFHAASIDANLQGEITSDNPVDVYAFFVDVPATDKESAKVEIRVTPPPGSSLDSQMTLYGQRSFFQFGPRAWAGGDILIASDDHSAADQNPFITQVVERGVYYVAVQSGGDEKSTGRYTLSLSYTYERTGAFSTTPVPPDGTADRPTNTLHVQQVSQILAADTNQDNIVDIIALNAPTTDQPLYTISVLVSRGEGSYIGDIGDGIAADPSPYVLPAFAGFDPADIQYIEARDVNGDGRVDIIAASSVTGGRGVLLGIGDGHFRDKDNALLIPAGDSRATIDPDEFANAPLKNRRLTIDMDRNGQNDLITINGAGLDAGWALKQLAFPQQFVTLDPFVQLTFPVELPKGSFSEPDRFPVGYFKAEGAFFDSETESGAYPPVDPVILDLVGDNSADDLITVARDGRVFVRYHDAGTDTYSFPEAIRYQAENGEELLIDARSVVVLRSGARAQLAVVGQGARASVLVFTRVPGAGPTQASWKLETWPGPTTAVVLNGIASGDLDKDGENDLVFTDGSLDGVQIFRRIAEEAFTAQKDRALLSAGVSIDGISLKDVDGDGKLDVLIINQVSGDIGIFFNETVKVGDIRFSTELRLRGYGTGLPIGQPQAAYGMKETIASLIGNDAQTRGLVALTLLDNETKEWLINLPIYGDPDPENVTLVNKLLVGFLATKIIKEDPLFPGVQKFFAEDATQAAITVILKSNERKAVKAQQLALFVADSLLPAVPDLTIKGLIAGFLADPANQIGLIDNIDVLLTGEEGDRTEVLVGLFLGVQGKAYDDFFPTFAKTLVARSLFQTSAVAVANFDAGPNNAGSLGIATTNPGVDDIAILMGKSTGTFVDATAIHLAKDAEGRPLLPKSIVSKDFNNDGRPDLAVLLTGTHQVVILLNQGRAAANGAIQFKEQPGPDGNRIDVGPGANGLTLATGADNEVRLMLTNEAGDLIILNQVKKADGSVDGTFFYAKPTNREKVSLAFVDINGDGKKDFVYTNEAMDNVSVELGNNSAADLKKEENGVNAPYLARVVDLNGDNWNDLVVVNAGSNYVLVYQALGNGQFQAAQRVFTGTNPVDVTFADLDGNGVKDLVVPNRGSNDVAVIFGELVGVNWQGTQGPRLKNAGLGQPSAVAVTDQNGDGIADIVISNGIEQNLAVIQGVGNGFFRDQNVTFIPTTGFPTAFVPPQANVPNSPIVVITDQGVQAFTNSLTPAAPFFFMTNAPTDAFAVDANQDGFSDLVVANRDENAISLLLGGPDRFQLVDTQNFIDPSSIAFDELVNGQVRLFSTSGNEDPVRLSLGLDAFLDGPLGPTSGVGGSPLDIANTTVIELESGNPLIGAQGFAFAELTGGDANGFDVVQVLGSSEGFFQGGDDGEAKDDWMTEGERAGGPRVPDDAAEPADAVTQLLLGLNQANDLLRQRFLEQTGNATPVAAAQPDDTLPGPELDVAGLVGVAALNPWGILGARTPALGQATPIEADNAPDEENAPQLPERAPDEGQDEVNRLPVAAAFQDFEDDQAIPETDMFGPEDVEVLAVLDSHWREWSLGEAALVALFAGLGVNWAGEDQPPSPSRLFGDRWRQRRNRRDKTPARS